MARRKLRCPATLCEVVHDPGSLDALAVKLERWVATFRGATRAELLAVLIADEPALLKGRILAGDSADRWLAATVHRLASEAGCNVPSWARRRQKSRRLSLYDRSP